MLGKALIWMKNGLTNRNVSGVEKLKKFNAPVYPLSEADKWGLPVVLVVGYVSC